VAQAGRATQARLNGHNDALQAPNLPRHSARLSGGIAGVQLTYAGCRQGDG
jgi:hypothetical protein